MRISGLLAVFLLGLVRFDSRDLLQFIKLLRFPIFWLLQ